MGLEFNLPRRLRLPPRPSGSLFNEFASKSATKFVFDISDCPWHTDAWVKAKREELEGKGLKHVFAQEFLRDGTAGLEGQLIPGEWVEAAVDACTKLGIKPTGEKVAALDVADGGKDRSALTVRYGVQVELCKSRGDLHADGAGAWAYAIAAQNACQRSCTITSVSAPAPLPHCATRRA